MNGRGRGKHCPRQASASPVPEGQGQALNEQGHGLNEQGQALNGQGRALNGQGHTLNGQGHTLNGQGQALNGQGHTPNGQGQALNGQGHTPNGQGHTLNGQGHTPNGQGHALNGQGHALNGQGHAPNGQGHTLNGQGHTPNGQGHALNGQGHALNGQGRALPLLLGLILALALALRLWLWSRPEHPPANDEIEYLAVGMDLAQGYGFRFYDTYRWLRAPLYPLFLGFFFWLGPPRLATLVQALLSTATSYGFFLLGKRLFPGEAGERTGLVAALLGALLLPFATFPALFMSETLFTALLVAFLLFLLAVPPARPERRAGLTASAGLFLGLSALTRAVAFAFIPLAAGWLYLALRREGGAAGKPRPLLLALLFILTSLATIAPWTVRNALVYHRFIPLDTGASINLWAFYEPHESIEEIRAQLEAIPNPADRQAYALRKGWERLREDPGVFWRKLPQTFVILFRIKPIEDRFLKEPYREPSLPYFVLALLCDDGLYLLITVASLAALLFTPADRGKALALLWLLYNIAVMIVLHAEARYRQLLFPLLIPYAALALVRGRGLFRPAVRGRVWRAVALLLLLAGWGYCFLRYSPWDWTRVNLERGVHQMVGQVNRALGRPEAALRAYERAIAADEKNPEPYYDLGKTLEELGRLEEAARAYRWGWDRQANYLPCSAALGNVLRALGRPEEARSAFQGRFVADAAVVAWSWEHLAATPPPQLDLGDGLEYGLVRGVHAPEEVGGVTYRWTQGEARLRLGAPGSGQARLRVRLAAPRPGGETVVVEVAVNGRPLTSWEAGPAWTLYESPPFPVEEGETVVVSLQSTTFVPVAVNPASSDGRRLGIQVDRAALVSEITAPPAALLYTEYTPFP